MVGDSELANRKADAFSFVMTESVLFHIGGSEVGSDGSLDFTMMPPHP
jgi:hypothetical protein